MTSTFLFYHFPPDDLHLLFLPFSAGNKAASDGESGKAASFCKSGISTNHNREQGKRILVQNITLTLNNETLTKHGTGGVIARFAPK